MIKIWLSKWLFHFLINHENKSYKITGEGKMIDCDNITAKYKKNYLSCCLKCRKKLSKLGKPTTKSQFEKKLI